MKPVNLFGQRFGRLAVIASAEKLGQKTAWDCICDCGQRTRVATNKLTTGRTKSCGCFRREAGMVAGQNTAKHGHAKGKSSAEYRAWISLKARCLNPRDKDYLNYGGRGITVCERWLEGFENFLADMGLKPNDGLSIDRINNDGNYEPGNCRWATRSQQQSNRRPPGSGMRRKTSSSHSELSS